MSSSWARAWGDSWGLSWGLTYEANQEPLFSYHGSPATTRHVPSRRKLQGIVRRNPKLEEVTSITRRQADEDVLILLA